MIHTRRIALTVTLAGCALWHNAHALLDYYGYRHTAAYTYVDTDSGRFVHDSTVYFTQQKLGTMQLNISEISITRQGSYLDITEDAWISPNVTILNLPDLTDYYMFKGTLPVPPKAVVTGLVRW